MKTVVHDKASRLSYNATQICALHALFRSKYLCLVFLTVKITIADAFLFNWTSPQDGYKKIGPRSETWRSAQFHVYMSIEVGTIRDEANTWSMTGNFRLTWQNGRVLSASIRWDLCPRHACNAFSETCFPYSRYFHSDTLLSFDF